MSEAVRHPIFARVYRRIARQADEQGAAGHRAALVRGLAGRVIEVGAGTGLMFGHYPPGVDEVLAVEPEPRLRADAEGAARAAPVPIRVVAGTAESLPAPDGAFDAVVCSLVLCSVRDQGHALAEAARVLRPGGELRFYEHVRSDAARARRVQRTADRTLWPLLAGGCHLGRDTPGAIAGAGFELERVEPAPLDRPGAAEAILPHVIGAARLPG